MMSKAEVKPAPFFAERKLTCWRDREYDDRYRCRVSRGGDNRINLELDIIETSFANAVAEELARCLYDAVFILVGNLAGYVLTPTARDSIFERNYRGGVSGRWRYLAEGKFTCKVSDKEVYFVDMPAGTDDAHEEVCIYSMEDGGVEIVFEFMCYSFSMHDAVWLANALMEALECDPLDVLETTVMNSNLGGGFLMI
jgi:hypothetical protein